MVRLGWQISFGSVRIMYFKILQVSLMAQRDLCYWEMFARQDNEIRSYWLYICYSKFTSGLEPKQVKSEPLAQFILANDSLLLGLFILDPKSCREFALELPQWFFWPGRATNTILPSQLLTCNWASGRENVHHMFKQIEGSGRFRSFPGLSWPTRCGGTWVQAALEKKGCGIIFLTKNQMPRSSYGSWSGLQ